MLRQMTDSEWAAYQGAQGWADASKREEYSPWIAEVVCGGTVIAGCEAFQLEIHTGRDESVIWVRNESMSRGVARAVVAYAASMLEIGASGEQIAEALGMEMV